MRKDAAMSASQATDIQYTDQQVPYQQDGRDATLRTLPGLRGLRYMEFFLVGSVPVDGEYKGTCYNTSPVPPASGGRDTAPQALVDKLNPADLAKQLGVARVWLNPPRQWLLDNIDIPIGTTREFGGIRASWCAVMSMPKGEWPAFTFTTIARKSKFSFSKGATVHLLDDPNGNTWIMKSVTSATDPNNTFENISTIEGRLKLPAGWKYRTAVLAQDLILIPTSGVAHILSDNLHDVYDLTGDGYSNFKP
jgi:hypothetical protein